MTTPGQHKGRPVDNVTVRRAVGQFAAQPSQRGALDVLRECMFGELLLDITGSDAFTGDSFAAGSRLQIRTGTGPNGGSALYAFTHNHEVGRLYPAGTRTQSLVTPRRRRPGTGAPAAPRLALPRPGRSDLCAVCRRDRLRAAQSL